MMMQGLSSEAGKHDMPGGSLFDVNPERED